MSRCNDCYYEYAPNYRLCIIKYKDRDCKMFKKRDKSQEIKSEGKMMDIEQKRIDASESLIKVQSFDGNWNADPYMHGMLNGMMLIHSVFTDKSFLPYEAPKRWKYVRWYEKIIKKVTKSLKPIKSEIKK